MKDIKETVDLPDPKVQPLIHPLDLPQAKKSFALAWWLSALTLPTVFFGIAAVLWAISTNYVTPVLAPSIMAVCAVFARKFHLSEAWAHIPRSRQDTSRRVPIVWSTVRSAVAALVFLAGLIALIQWLIDRELPPEVTAYSAGACAGVVAIMVINLIWTLVAPARLNVALGGWAPQLASLLVTMTALAYGYQAVSATGTADRWEPSEILMGGVIIMGVQLLLWVLKLWPDVRQRQPQALSRTWQQRPGDS